jgi:hypothetical protein
MDLRIGKGKSKDEIQGSFDSALRAFAQDDDIRNQRVSKMAT